MKQGWTIAISWGENGGIYWYNGYSKRLCLYKLAITWIPDDLDDMLNCMHVSSPLPVKQE